VTYPADSDRRASAACPATPCAASPGGHGRGGFGQAVVFVSRRRPLRHSRFVAQERKIDQREVDDMGVVMRLKGG